MTHAIHEVTPHPEPRQSVVLATLEMPESDWEESLAELERLAETANGQVAAVLTQRRATPDPATFFGKGKVEQLREVVERAEANLVIVDGEISPSQQRNLEKLLDTQVIDRTGLILDIFARRARTAEGKLQVELAQLNYLLPRLANMWTHLERIRGGIGLRGPGETQIETDRRLIRQRIGQLRRKVEEIRLRRQTLRAQRAQSQIPLVSLVGYTNAGKSTLLNALSDAEVFVEDKLFATLDPTTRDVLLPNGLRILLSDTVGFIRNLPTQLVAAFRSTLEESTNADVLIHVVDAANPAWVEQVETVERVLHELGISDKPVIMAFNKIDSVADPEVLRLIAGRYAHQVFLAARRGEGLAELADAIAVVLRERWQAIDAVLPLSASQLVAELHARGEVEVEEYEGHTVHLIGRGPQDIVNRILTRAQRA